MKYTETHEWIDVKGNIGTVGITHYAQQELGDIVYVELPLVGGFVEAGGEAAVVESTKSAADVYSPVSGKIIEINRALEQSAELVNRSAEGTGWIFKVELSDLSELDSLLNAAEYKANLQ